MSLTCDRSAIFWQVSELQLSAQFPNLPDNLRPIIGVNKIAAVNQQWQDLESRLCKKLSKCDPVWTCWPKLVRNCTKNVRTAWPAWMSNGRPADISLSEDGEIFMTSQKKRIIWFLQGILATPTVGRKISSQSGNCDNMLSSVTCQKMALLLLLKVGNT